jgi:hypothetical protein
VIFETTACVEGSTDEAVGDETLDQQDESREDAHREPAPAGDDH